MDRLSNFLFVVWIIMAIAAFVGAFFIVAPLSFMIVNLVFGVLNLSIILCWISATRQAKKEYKKKQLEE